jgi:hypothetical protein
MFSINVINHILVKYGMAVALTQAYPIFRRSVAVRKLQSRFENAAIVVIGAGLAMGIVLRAFESLRAGAGLFGG